MGDALQGLHITTEGPPTGTFGKYKIQMFCIEITFTFHNSNQMVSLFLLTEEVQSNANKKQF